MGRIIRIPGSDLMVADAASDWKRFSADGLYLGPINVGPYILVAANSTRMFCVSAGDREIHVLTFDGQHLAQFGAGVIGIAGAKADGLGLDRSGQPPGSQGAFMRTSIR